MTDLQFKIAMLDAALTRKSWAEVEHTALHTNIDVVKLASNPYHLSDGGYSRLCISINPDDTITAFLDSISRPEVKAGWRYCVELIEDVQNAAELEWKPV